MSKPSKASIKLWNVAGIGAMICLHASALPVLIRVLNGDFENLPPLDYVMLVYIGLIGMTARYYYFVQDKVAVISNMIGVYFNFFIICAIMYTRFYI